MNYQRLGETNILHDEMLSTSLVVGLCIHTILFFHRRDQSENDRLLVPKALQYDGSKERDRAEYSPLSSERLHNRCFLGRPKIK